MTPDRPKTPLAAYVVIGVGALCALYVISMLLISPRTPALRVACMSNVKQQALAMQIYSNDYDSRLPAASHWMDRATEYTKSKGIFHCPEVSQEAFGYGMNIALSGKRLDKVQHTERVVMLFESKDTSWNAFGNLANEQAGPRHSGKNNFGFADGHAKASNPEAFGSSAPNGG